MSAGLVEAYRLESEVARMPRVIVDPKVLEIARVHRSDIHSAEEEEQYVRAALVEEGDLLWLDYISWNSVVAVAGCEPEGYPRYLENIRKLVRRGLSHCNAGVLEKYLWLHWRLSNEIKHFREVPAHADPQLESERLQVAKLGLMKKRARKAREKVERAAQDKKKIEAYAAKLKRGH